ncbi:hypothetical protein RRG08_018814 [Elysia crispata]|uniref:Uncharacterized protein n=1 Tax=Elysia crispata TaxID=231223 RepID=A0AAE1DMG1_9GAST|nr:hypothetical protein RRG08_018814 [Elysia crispata]
MLKGHPVQRHANNIATRTLRLLIVLLSCTSPRHRTMRTAMGTASGTTCSDRSKLGRGGIIEKEKKEGGSCALCHRLHLIDRHRASLVRVSHSRAARSRWGVRRRWEV